MFRKRVDQGKPIYEHELVYPLRQGFDSVALDADLTIIGSDQLFNEMIGRSLQERFGKCPQIIITSKITPGIDGGEKQSKSLGNYIGLSHSPREKFGRIMSIRDNFIVEYFKVYTDISLERIDEIEKLLVTDPMGWKLELAQAIVARYHGQTIAEQERSWFTATFSRKEAPELVPAITVTREQMTLFEVLRSCFPQSEKSNGELRRLISQGAVRVNGELKKFPEDFVKISSHGTLLKIGKLTWFKAIRTE